MALDIAFQVGKHTLQVGFGGLFALGAVTSGIRCISGLVGLCNESEPEGDAVVSTGKKVQDIFLAGVRSIGMSAATFHWADFCGWISLGAAAPIIGFIGYPTLLITSIFDLYEQWNQLVEIHDKPNLDNYEWRVGIEALRLLSQVCLVAYSVIEAVAVVTGDPTLALVAFATIFIHGFFLGAAAVASKKIDRMAPRAVPAA